MASEAADALAILRGEERIDILFSDVVMPGGMNGVQLSVDPANPMPFAAPGVSRLPKLARPPPPSLRLMSLNRPG